MKEPIIEYGNGIIKSIIIMPSEERIKEALRFERRREMLENPRVAQRYLDKYNFFTRIPAIMGITKNAVMYRTARKTMDKSCKDYL